MIVPNMSELEIYNQLKYDLAEYKKSEKSKSIANSFRKYLRRNKREDINFGTFEYISEKFKNTMYIMYYAIWDKKHKQYIQCTRSYAICYNSTFNHKQGYTVYEINQQLEPSNNTYGKSRFNDELRKSIVIYPYHFWERYKERLDKYYTGLQLVKRFFEDNKFITFDVKNIADEEKELILGVEEGVGLGIFKEDIPNNFNICIVKTFVASKMLYSNQMAHYYNIWVSNMQSIEYIKENGFY